MIVPLLAWWFASGALAQECNAVGQPVTYLIDVDKRVQDRILNGLMLPPSGCPLEDGRAWWECRGAAPLPRGMTVELVVDEGELIEAWAIGPITAGGRSYAFYGGPVNDGCGGVRWGADIGGRPYRYEPVQTVPFTSYVSPRAAKESQERLDALRGLKKKFKKGVKIPATCASLAATARQSQGRSSRLTWDCLQLPTIDATEVILRFKDRGDEVWLTEFWLEGPVRNGGPDLYIHGSKRGIEVLAELAWRLDPRWRGYEP